MDLKTIVVSALIAAAVGVGFVAIALKGPVSVGPDGKVQVGSVTNPEIPSPWVAWGGVFNYAGSLTALKTATTTVCAIQSPAATSTLENFQIRFDVSSSMASIVTIAKSNTAFATTTQLGTDYAIAAGAQAFIQASSSPQAGTANIFGPNQWLVVGMRGGAGTFSPTGTCQANWISS